MSCRDNESAGEEANAYLCRVSAAQPGSRSLWSTIITPLGLLECHACFDIECRFSPATQKACEDSRKNFSLRFSSLVKDLQDQSYPTHPTI